MGQKKGTNFEESLASTASFRMIRVVLEVFVAQNLEVCQIGVEFHFPNGYLKEVCSSLYP